jgi:hypothetical protein
MAVSVPRLRGWAPGQAFIRLLLLGLVAAVALAVAYVLIFGNPLGNTQRRSPTRPCPSARVPSRSP